MKKNGNSERPRRENRPRGVGSGRGIYLPSGRGSGEAPLPSGGGVWGEGRDPSPENFLIFCQTQFDDEGMQKFIACSRTDDTNDGGARRHRNVRLELSMLILTTRVTGTR